MGTNVSYGYMQDFGGSTKVTAIKSPSATVLACDVKMTLNSSGGKGWDQHVNRPGYFGAPPVLPANDADADPVSGDSAWTARPRGLHSNLCTVGWVDGHAEARRTPQFFYSQTPTDLYFDLN